MGFHNNKKQPEKHDETNCPYEGLYKSTARSMNDLASNNQLTTDAHDVMRKRIRLALKREYPNLFSSAERELGAKIADVDDEVLLSLFDSFLANPREVDAWRVDEDLDDVHAALADLGIDTSTARSAAEMAELIRSRATTTQEPAQTQPTSPPVEDDAFDFPAPPLGPADYPQPVEPDFDFEPVDAPPSEDFDDLFLTTPGPVPAPGPEQVPDPTPSSEVPFEDLFIVPENSPEPVEDVGNFDDLFLPEDKASSEPPPATNDYDDLFLAPEPNPTPPAPEEEPTPAEDPEPEEKSTPKPPPSVPKPARRRRVRKKSATVSASKPLTAEQADDPMISMVALPRPVFMNDLEAVAGSPEQADDWEKRMRNGFPSSPVRFVQPKSRNKERGPLVLPTEALLEIVDPEPGWWFSAVDSPYRAGPLYELAILLSRTGNDLFSYNYGPELAVLQTNTNAGVEGIIVVMDAKSSNLTTALEAALDDLLKNSLVSVSVLTTIVKDEVDFPALIDQIVRENDWEVSFPVLYGKVWDWGAATGGAIVQVLLVPEEPDTSASLVSDPVLDNG